MWEPRCSTPEPTSTPFSCLHTPHAKHLRPLQSVFMNVQPPHFMLFFRYLHRSLKRWEVSHDRDDSTSPSPLTFHTPCFAILLMHGQRLFLLPFWRVLNVEQCLEKKKSKQTLQLRCSISICSVVWNYLLNCLKLMTAFITTWPSYCCKDE